MFQKQTQLQEPFRQAGMTAQQQIMQLLGIGGDANAAGYGSAAKPFGMDQFEADPGYAFRQSEGMKALERSAAARGGLLSGTTGKNLLRYGQEMGSQEYGAARNRYIQDYLNRLSAQQTLAGYGTGATNALAAAASQYGQQAGAGLTDIAKAQAGGTVGAANALTGALGTGLNYMSSSNLADAIRQSGYRNPYAVG